MLWADEHSRWGSLRHYLVVEQDRPLVEHYRRDGDGSGWSVEVVKGPARSAELDAIGVTLGLDRVYEGVGEGW